MNLEQALKYLIDNNVYTDEWTGTGMYEIIADLVKSERRMWKEEELDYFLNIAKNK
jgi:hypothetical protein